MKKETLKVIIIAVVVTLLAVAFINAIVKKEEGMVRVPLGDVANSIDQNSFKKDFIGGCTEEGGTYSGCSCMWDSLVRQLGFDGVVDMTLDYLKTEKLPLAVMAEAYNDCY